MKIFHKDNFLSVKEIEYFISIYNIIENNNINSIDTTKFWEKRYFDVFNILDNIKDKESYSIFFKLIKKIKNELEIAFPESYGYQADSLQFVKFSHGDKQEIHSDNINLDGTPSHAPWRVFSCIIYLNNEFEGGRTIFPEFNYEIDPVPGRLAIFACDVEHRHGVEKVLNGERKTLISFWSPVIINKRLQVS